MVLTYSWVYCLAGLSPHSVNNCFTFDSHNSAYNQDVCLKLYFYKTYKTKQMIENPIHFLFLWNKLLKWPKKQFS